MHRRDVLQILAGTGIGAPALHRAISVMASRPDGLTAESLQQAEWITQIPLDETEREAILKAVNDHVRQFESLREIPLPATLGPALHFQTLAPPSNDPGVCRNARVRQRKIPCRPADDEELAFLPVTALSGLIRSRQISSLELTRLYLARLKKYSPMLRCTVTLTEELAEQQAKQADAEIQCGKYRGPLHGIPWGAKDLISVPGYPTTWGIPALRDQVLEETATVARQLEQAGAVLVAKLSLGALAMGDRWFGGMTRNPWNPRTGSSGSSAGSASATAAGLVGFSIGSETLGSITSPAKQCGVTGFRPTFGRVSRYGCMPLSWSMDKIGPICRSVEDCALVFDAIHGADPLDPTTANRPFAWPTPARCQGMKIGYQAANRNPERPRPELEILQQLGCQLVDLGPPPQFENYRALAKIIDIEGASVMDQMLRDGQTEGWNSWKNIFQSAQFISAIDYLRLQRLRSRLMQQFEDYIAPVDALVNVFEIFQTNLAGHPCVVLPREFSDARGGGKRPLPLTLTGHLNRDDQLLALAHAVQGKLTAHQQRPPLDDWLLQYEAGELDPKPAGNAEAKPEAKPDQSAKPDNQNGKPPAAKRDKK
ncbi:MAG: amidase [Mariniblastus sp.]|nr:amidase [Mariniblastus sp.]